MKTCLECSMTKPLDAFHKCKTVKDGRKSRCAECCNSRNREWRATNPDKAKASVETWRRNNAERYREAKRASDRRYNAENADKLREWREANREKLAEDLARWKAANREKVRDYERRRRAAVRGSRIEEIDLDAVWAMSGGVCALCGNALDQSISWPDRMSVSLDHITPLSRGGAHSTENARYVHLVCNMSKNNRLDCEIMTSAVSR